MAENSGGEVISRETEFRIYDSLPPEARRALQDAPIQFGAATARRFVFKGYDSYSDLMSIFRDYMTGGEDFSTRTAWTYHINRPGYLRVGRHDGKDHPQSDRNYKWTNYQLTPRRTRVVNIRRNTI